MIHSFSAWSRFSYQYYCILSAKSVCTACCKARLRLVFGQTDRRRLCFSAVSDIIMAAARAGNVTTFQKFYNAFRSWYIYAAGYRQLGKLLLKVSSLDPFFLFSFPEIFQLLKIKCGWWREFSEAIFQSWWQFYRGQCSGHYLNSAL